MGVVALATYSHGCEGIALAKSRWSKATYGCGCEGRSPSLKPLIFYKYLLQTQSTLYIQGAFFIENWRSQFYMAVGTK